ncbi:MAG: RHS repeat-associated core domain-containing protein [Anaerolineae bacterium]
MPYFEDFQTANGGWSTSGTVAWNVYDSATHTSTVRATGVGNYVPVIARTAPIADGQGARVAFKLGQTNSQAGLELDTGSGSGYYRVAVYEAGGKLYQALAYPSGGGTTYVNPTVLVDAFQANTWYVLEVTANDGAGSRVSVWAESAPNTRYEARWGMPTGQAWTFRGWVYTSGTTLWLDTYREEPPSVKTADVRYAGQHYEDDRGPTPSVTKRYYAEGKLLATRTGATLTYVQSDHLGSTSTLTDASGSVIARERYSAFGERRRSDNLALTDQLYTGQQYNTLSGLYHYSDGKSAGRFYDPLLARFIQPDSITPGTGSQPLNRYAYSLNNPVKFVDPNGHAPALSDPGGVDSPTWILTSSAVAPEEQRATFARWFDEHPNYSPESDPILTGAVRDRVPWDLDSTRAKIEVEYGAWKLERGAVAEGAAHMAAGGRSFCLMEGGCSLPAQRSGYYTEYVVPTPGYTGVGPQRLVVGQGGEAYYTPDHYQTFIRVQ